MHRRDFIKTTSTAVITSATSFVFADEFPMGSLTGTTPPPALLRRPYFVNCYIQNQKFWPLEEYKRGSFKNGKLYFGSFQEAVDFVDMHSLVTPFYNEISYEVFHEISEDAMVAPKHIFTYWVKIKKGETPETIRWIRPDYIDQTADGALIEHV